MPTLSRAVLSSCVMVMGLLVPLPAAAQSDTSRRVAVDSVVGVQDLWFESRDWPTAVVLDPFVSARITRGLQVAARPKLWRLNGEWDLVLDQASIQYQRHWHANWRVEAGRFPSPVGLGMTENRASTNPGLLWWHRPYYMPLPDLGPGAPRVSLVSATYPDGLVVSASTAQWDGRVAVIDRAPVEFWHGETHADRAAHVVVGGGITPLFGLRVGAVVARGDLTSAPDGQYRLINIEGDYAFAYTRVSGEWTHDVFDMPGGRRVARGWTLQAQQTLTPRLFAHARVTSMAAPEVIEGGLAEPRAFRSIDATLGYRVDAELTIRAGYSAVEGWRGGAVDHHAGLSLMWARRWW